MKKGILRAMGKLSRALRRNLYLLTFEHLITFDVQKYDFGLFCVKNGLERARVGTGQTTGGPCHNQVRNLGGLDSGSHRRNGGMWVV